METINGCTVISDATDFVPYGPAETAGAYFTMIGVLHPGDPGPPFHVHPNTDEAFYVAEGKATFRLGDRELELGDGAFVFVPRGTAHTAWNSGDAPVRGLIIISPGDVEHEIVPAEG